MDTNLINTIVGIFLGMSGKPHKDRQGRTVYKVPAAYGWLGVVCAGLFSVCLVASLIVMDDVKDLLFVVPVFGFFVLLGVFLAWYSFVRKYVVDGDRVVYTNIFRQENTWYISDITEIRQKWSQDYECWSYDEKLFPIDQQLPGLMEEITRIAAERGRTIRVVPKQKKKK